MKQRKRIVTEAIVLSDRLWGTALVTIGAIIIWSGWSLWQSERSASMFDALGPDRYIIFIGGLLILAGICIGLGASAPSANAGREESGKSYVTPAGFLIALSVYALAIPWLGYTISTFLFFVGAFFLAGRRNIVSTLVASVISAAVFYLIFPFLAEMPLPTGAIGF